MSWGDPWILCALLLPLAAAWLVRGARRDAKPLWPALRRVSITASNSVHASSPGKMAPAYIIMAAVALSVIAMARPKWGEQPEQSFSQSREVMIALDLSRSMWAEDMPGPTSRLSSAKATLERLLGNLKGENVGLVLFAGTAFVQVPMSPDYQIIREFLPTLNPNYMPKGGSDYGRMLDAALQGFGDGNDRDRYLVVLSDGESTTAGWEKKLPDLLRHNIHVVGIGFGTEKGAFIPDQKGGRLLDKNKESVVSHLTPATPQTLAERTDGAYVAATALPDSPAIGEFIKDTVESGRAGRVRNTATDVGIDRFQWFLVPAVLLGLVSLAREFRRHPRPRQVRPIAAPTAAPSTAALLTLLLFVPMAPRVDARYNSEASVGVKETAAADPAKRVRAIAADMGAKRVRAFASYHGKIGYDPVDLQLLVEASIQYGANERSRGRMPLKGVVHDAVDAARVGKMLSPQLGPWDNYESQLEDLLAPLPAPPEEKAQDKGSDDDDDDDDPDEASNRRPPLRKAKDKDGKDLYGKNSKGRTEFALGDLSADENFMPQESHGPRRRPPKPPQPTLTPETQGATDPTLAEARKNMVSVVKADSPGRVHQLLAGEIKQPTVDEDW